MYTLEGGKRGREGGRALADNCLLQGVCGFCAREFDIAFLLCEFYQLNWNLAWGGGGEKRTVSEDGWMYGREGMEGNQRAGAAEWCTIYPIRAGRKRSTP